MLARLIEFSLRQRMLVMLGALALAGAGMFAFLNLPIDAYPDISPTPVPYTHLDVYKRQSPLRRHKLLQSLAQHNRRTFPMRAVANVLSLPCQCLDAAVKPQPRRISRTTVWIISIVGLVLAAVLWGWWSYSRPAASSAATTPVLSLIHI